MKTVLIVFVFFFSLQMARAQMIFPVPNAKIYHFGAPIEYVFDIRCFCANTNFAITAINECKNFEIGKYVEISLFEITFSRQVSNWKDIALKCYNNAFYPNFRSMEKLLKCLKTEVRKALTQ